MVGMFVCLCLASQHPFEREFFVPARSDLGVKLLSCLKYLFLFLNENYYFENPALYLGYHFGRTAAKRYDVSLPNILYWGPHM
jgi:hypothetical protein